MADWTSSEKTVTTRIYELCLPSNAVQLHQVLDAAWRSCGEMRCDEPADDSISVESDGEVLRLSFTVEERPATGRHRMIREEDDLG